MGLGSIIGTGLDVFLGTPGVFSGIGSSLDSEKSQGDANQANLANAREVMAFQKEMSSTSYQRAVKDMQAAGLNPMLAYSQGGASTPTGSLAAPVQNTAAVGVSSAAQQMQAVSAAQGVLQSRAATDQAKATADKLRSETLENSVNTAAKLAETKQREADTKLTSQKEQTEFYETALRQGRNAAEVDADAPGGRTYGGFRADVEKRKQDAELSRLEVSKQHLLKGAYDILDRNRGAIEHSAGSLWDWMKEKGSDLNQWYENKKRDYQSNRDPRSYERR